MSEELKTYLVSLHGRGASYAFLVKGEVQDVANRCKPCTNSGFEVYIYELMPSPHGAPGFAPTGSTPLKQVYHLYDAHDLWVDEARGIVDKLTMHSEVASLEYLASMINVLNTEVNEITRRRWNVKIEDQQMQAPGNVEQPELRTVVSETPSEKSNPGQSGENLTQDQPVSRCCARHPTDVVIDCDLVQGHSGLHRSPSKTGPIEWDLTTGS